MEKATSIFELSEVHKGMGNYLNTGGVKGEILIADITNETGVAPESFFHVNVFLVMIVTKGEATITIDHETYVLSCNQVLTVMAEHVIRFNSKTSDFTAKMFTIDKDVLSFSTFNISPDAYLYIKKHPVQKFLYNEVDDLCELFDLMNKKSQNLQREFSKKTVYCLLFAFFCELSNFVNKTSRVLQQPSFSHKENIYRNFFILLREHVKENKNVSFYANQLCITSQYLSSVLKELSGLTANKWIDEMLISEAKLQLHFTQNNIQQIANELNFPDQSSFGKFFKKMTGRSPKAYRLERIS